MTLGEMSLLSDFGYGLAALIAGVNLRRLVLPVLDNLDRPLLVDLIVVLLRSEIAGLLLRNLRVSESDICFPVEAASRLVDISP